MPAARSPIRQPVEPFKVAPGARSSVQDHVYQSIRRGLMVGAFLPGQVLSLRKLAAKLGTSVMPVREAFARLASTSALEATATGSVQIPRLSPTKLRELFAVREALEGMASELACQKATPALRKSLTLVNRQLLKAIAGRDLLSCLALNQQFHFTLYDAAESEVLIPLIEALWLQFGPTMYLTLLSPELPWNASIHTVVLDGLAAGDAALVRSGVVQDIQRTGKSLEAALGSQTMGALLAPSFEKLFFAS